MATHSQVQKKMNNVTIPQGFKLVRVGWMWDTKNKSRYFSRVKISNKFPVVKEKPVYILERI